MRGGGVNFVKRSMISQKNNTKNDNKIKIFRTSKNSKIMVGDVDDFIFKLWLLILIRSYLFQWKHILKITSHSWLWQTHFRHPIKKKIERVHFVTVDFRKIMIFFGDKQVKNKKQFKNSFFFFIAKWGQITRVFRPIRLMRLITY